MLPMNNGWISVDDAMPPLNGTVLLVVDDIYISKGFFCKYDFKFKYELEDLELAAFNIELGDTYPSIEDKETINVTHWMPLPKLPEDKHS